jgi:cytolysin (calcineurin-like family phosphatase)
MRGRAALAAALIAVLGCAPAAAPPAAPPPGLDVTFFAIGDPQIHIARWGTAGTDSTVVLMNGLPGQPFPFGGAVAEPAGVIIAGDLVDDVASAADWDYYKTLFDPQGRARLRFPAYEGLGNHNVDVRRQPLGTFNEQQREFIERNRRRPGEFVFDEHGYHYSWQWGGVRFIQLNLFPGTRPRPVYDAPSPGNDPKGSLAFLRQVLRSEVGASGQPIVVTWHYGLRGWGLEKWWLPEDLDSLAAVLQGYNVLLLLHGHEHRYERYQWRGYDVIMAPAPQYDRDPEEPQTASRPKGFLVFRITADELQMAHRTASGWEETWSKPIRRPAPPQRE